MLQHEGLGADAGEVLTQIVVQRVGQLRALVFLHAEQPLGQVLVALLGLLQGAGHAVEALGQLVQFRLLAGGQPRIEAPSRDLMQAAEQLLIGALAAAKRPVNRQQRDRQRGGKHQQQELHRFPDFAQLVVRVGGDVPLGAVVERQRQRREAFIHRRLQPADQPARHVFRRGCGQRLAHATYTQVAQAVELMRVG